MADKAAARHEVIKQKTEAELRAEYDQMMADRTPNDERYLAKQFVEMTNEELVYYLTPLNQEWACACVGSPPGCSKCFCHLNHELRARLNNVNICAWCINIQKWKDERDARP